MRMILLSALFAFALGLAGSTTASAAPISGLNTAANSSSMLTEVQYYYRHHYRHHYYRHHYRHRVRCRSVRVCRWTPYGRRCHYERVCRRW